MYDKSKYDPSGVGVKGSIFGLPYSIEESDLVFIPVHLDTTVSYFDGTNNAPRFILEESSQLDLSLVYVDKPWELKMAYDHQSIVSTSENGKYRNIAKSLIQRMESGEEITNSDELKQINDFCEKVKNSVKEKSQYYLNQGKKVGIIGGDHSSPLGLLEALSEKHDFSILQIDSHMDLRKSYEGFTYSHASVMHNAMDIKGVKSLTQVGIRDFCEEEEIYIKNSQKPVITFYDKNIFWGYLEGKSWADITEAIVSTLSDKVYISFDVDGLDPSLCPNSGTPVAGGLSYNQVIFLIDSIARHGKQIIGFDLCETGPASWDANVASRILFQLATYTGVSNGLLKFR